MVGWSNETVWPEAVDVKKAGLRKGPFVKKPKTVAYKTKVKYNTGIAYFRIFC
jgi:hypothetical protein